MTENNTKLISKTQKVNFISSTSYKIIKKIKNKLTLLT